MEYTKKIQDSLCEALKNFVISENVLKRIGYASELEDAKQAIAKAEATLA